MLKDEAGRDGFWLARWLRARDVEAYVIHPTSVAVSREHRRAKTDRLDTELLKRSFLGWLRGEKRHRSMVAIPTIQDYGASGDGDDMAPSARFNSYRWSAPCRNFFDASRSLTALEQDSTIIAAIEMSQSKWLVAAVVPGVERQPLKKLNADEEALLKLLYRWRHEAGLPRRWRRDGGHAGLGARSSASSSLKPGH